MLFKTASTTCCAGNPIENAHEAVRSLRDQFKGFNAGLLLFFCSSDYDSGVIAADMMDAFPGVVTMGCTSAGEGVDNKIMNRAVVAMAYAPEVFTYCEFALVLADKKKAAQAARPDVFWSPSDAAKYVARNVGHNLRGLNHRDFVGFMLGDRISDFTEGVIERFGDLNDVTLIGGMAGDDYNFDKSARVMYQGKAYADAAVLSLWKPANGFSLLKTQAVQVTNHSAVVTKADEQRNIVWELDGRDAASVYSGYMGIPVETMNVLDFDENPWASTVNGEPYLRACMNKVDEKGLHFMSRIRQGTRLTLTRAGDILSTTREALEARKREMGSLSAILHINCASRHTALRKWGQVEEFAELFGGVPSVSVSSYGEVYVGIVAMTSTMLLFK